MFALLLLAGAGGLYVVRKWYKQNLQATSTNGEVRNVTIKSGMGLSSIADMLEKEGLIRNAKAFETYVRGRKLATELKAGVYEISPSMNVEQVVDVLVSGKEANSLFTIGPGKRLDQIKAKLLKDGYTQEDIDSAMDPNQYKDIGIISELPSGKSLEGFLYPDSFQITVSSSPRDIVRQSLKQLDSVVTPKLKEEYKKQGLSVYEAITLASIIEKEVSGKEDRRMVAQVMLKRLNEGMNLGADATYLYASVVYGGEPFPSNSSPYNTRLYPGLPPGPISNAGLSSLEAVAYPAPGDYLYYVTGDDGVNHFTRTSLEHEQATAKYCSVTCAPGYVPDSL